MTSLDGFVPLIYWSVVEPGLSTLVICLPPIFQLFKRLHSFGPRSLLNSRDYSRSLRPNHDMRKSQRETPGQSTVSVANRGSCRASEDRPSSKADLAPLRSIHVAENIDADTLDVGSVYFSSLSVINYHPTYNTREMRLINRL